MEKNNIHRIKSKSNISPKVTGQINQEINFSFDKRKNSPETEHEESSIIEDHKQIFKNLNIYVEIFNNNTNQSDCVIPILKKFGANINIKIKKNTDYIIFKDGRKQVLQKALDNNIKLISPLWIHDCTIQGNLLDTSCYLIKKTYTELFFDNKKRKYNDVVMNTTKSMGTPGKRRKIQKNILNKDYVSPVVVEKESKIKSEIVPVKFLKRKDEEQEVLAVKEELNNNAIEVGEDSFNSLFKERSVFGENIRCFNEDKYHKQNPKEIIDLKENKNNKENLKIPHSSVKIKEKFYNHNFTPVNYKIKSLNINSYNKAKSDNEDIYQKTNINKIDFDKIMENINVSAAKISNFPNAPKIENIKNRSLNIFNEYNGSKYRTEEKKNSILKKFDEMEIDINKSKLKKKNNYVKLDDLKLIENSDNTQIKNYFKPPEKLKVCEREKEPDDFNNSLVIANNNIQLSTFNAENLSKSKVNENLSHIKQNNHSSKNNINFNIPRQNPNEKKYSFSSFNIKDVQKEKLKTIFKNLNSASTSSQLNHKIISANKKDPSKNRSHIYLGDNLTDINDSEYVIIKNSNEQLLFKELLILYISLLNNKKLDESGLNSNTNRAEKFFIKFSYFTDCEKKKKFIPMENYLVKFSIDFLSLDNLKKENNLPFKSFKIFLHPSTYTEKDLEGVSSPYVLIDDAMEDYKQKTLYKLVQLLGGDIVNHIRLCDMCVINKVDSSQQYFPPHVKNIHMNFILDTIENLKLPDLEHFKYKPIDGKYQKNRK